MPLGGHEWFWLFGFGQVVFWGFLILLLVAVFKRRPEEPVAGPSKPKGLAILEERYARGEIDRDEFLERRSILTDQTGRT